MNAQDPRTPQFSQSQGASQHVFRVTPNLASPSSQPRSFGRGVLRPVQQPQKPYTGPYTTVPGSSRPSGNGVSAEQQIAQGVLSNTSAGGGGGGSGSSTPQRRPPPLGTTIHVPANGTPQNQPMTVNHAMNPTASLNTTQRQSGSPALQHLNAQRSAMNTSPANASSLGGNEQQDDHNQDLSMIDPQLAIDEQLIPSDASHPRAGPSPDEPSVVQGEMLSPPPGGSFPTFEALFSYAQAHALAHGYAFVIGRSKRDNRGLKKVFLICDRGGNNKEKVPGEARQRKTRSRKCGCEFGVFGLEGKTAWLLRGRIDGEHLVHNHPPSESPTEHPGARKLDPKAIAAVKALEENGVSVKETLEILHRENPNVRYLPRDIYNARAAIKRDPSRVEATALEELPTFYKKPPMTFEEKLRAELRTEVANAQAEVEKTKEAWRKEVEDLKEQLRNKDKMIQKFEMFIDICNERVMVQRERLEGESSAAVAGQ